MWILLGIAPTHDPKVIKRAYARQLKQNHPEDHPENFQRLHEAYQAALKGCASEFGHELTPLFAKDSLVEECALPSKQNEAQINTSFQMDMSLIDTRSDTDETDAIFISALDELDSLNQKTSVERWRDLFEKTTVLSLQDKTLFEGELLTFLFKPLKGRRKTIIAAEMHPAFFSLIDEYFDWRENELDLLEGQFEEEEHRGVFLNCLYQYPKPTVGELLNLFETLLSSPHKNTSLKSWRNFFGTADLLEKNKRYKISNKTFKILVAHFHTSGLALSPVILNALDRLFGWTRSWFRHRHVRLTRACSKMLKDDTSALLDMLTKARAHSAIYAPSAKYRRSISSGFMCIFHWIWLSILTLGVLFSSSLAITAAFLISLSIFGFSRLKRMLFFG